jgi:hypothetical protein
MNTFSMKSGSASETKRRGDPSDSENGDQVILSEEEIAAINKKEESDNAEESSSMEGLDNKIEQEASSESSENSDSGETDKPAKSTLEKNDPQNQESDNKETQSNELQSEESSSENMAPGEQKGDDGSYERQDREERQSGEFNEENIRGKLQDGEQMKSFIRALPHIVDPSLQDKEIIYYYRNQLETAIENEILPEGYESVIRDYFLGIGVLNE